MPQCRKLIVGLGTPVVMAGSWIALDQAWYADYERSPFHGFDDGAEWAQMDKVGHIWSAYTLGRVGQRLFKWSGKSDRSALWMGGSLGLVYLTGVEVLDGTSSGWGFSAWDMAANVGGAALFIGQELAWKEQRITMKFSAHHTAFATLRPDLLGEGDMERVLKDYNGQTYWASCNLKAFLPRSRMPAWLNVAAGYGAEGMTNAHAWDSGSDVLRDHGAPFRQYFLSLDVDLTRIPSRSSFVRTVLFTLNCIKVPAPTLEFRSNGRVLGHGIYF